MDIIITDHSPKNLEETFDNHLLYQNEHFSIMGEATEIPWLQFIPNKALDKAYAGLLFSEIYGLAEHLKSAGLGMHYNIAKIGNKLPYYHIHLVFRDKKDQAWPETIWGLELKQDASIIEKMQSRLNDYYQTR